MLQIFYNNIGSFKLQVLQVLFKCLRTSLGSDAADIGYIIIPDFFFNIYKLNFKKDT